MIGSKFCVLLSSFGLLIFAVGCDVDTESALTSSISKLGFSSAPTTSDETSCKTLTLASYADTVVTAVTEATAVTLTSTTGSFYSDAACATAITSTTIAKDTNFVTLYWMSIKNGDATLTAAATGLTSATATVTVALTFLGTWTNTCHDDDGQVIDTYEFKADGSFTWTQNLHNDDDTTCTGDASQVFLITGTYSNGAANTSVTTANDIDLTFTKLEVTVTSDDMAETFNDYSIFTKTDWEANKLKDVTGLLSSDDGEGVSVTAGEVVKDAYQVSGTSLVVGQKFFTSTGGVRPTAIGTSGKVHIYTKQ